jgi:hypothetical protein
MNSREINRLKSSLKLTDEQRDVIIGVLLGDAHLETQNGGRTYRLKFEYSQKHGMYADHLYGIFREWVLTPPQMKTDNSRNNVWFQTVSHGAFRFYAGQFYDENRKCVPKLIHRYLTNRAIGYWYMDDGSMKSRESKGVIFNTHGFVRKDVDRLITCLRKKFNLDANIRKQKDGLQIYISGRSYDRFLEIVEPYIHESMRYKIPVGRKT